MKRLGKKNDSVEMSIEAYACVCGDCRCGGDCQCGLGLKATGKAVPASEVSNNGGRSANYRK